MKRIQTEKWSDLKSEIPLRTPYCIFIDPSNACNFKCVFCMNQKIKRPTTMRFDVYEKLINDLNEFEDQIKTIRLYGLGEPLINDSFCEMVKLAKTCGKVLNVDTTTNASLLNPKLNQSLVESGIDRINISIEAMNTDSYRKFTRNDKVTFEGIVTNIEHLYKLKTNTIIFIKIISDGLSEQEKDSFYEIFTPISDGCNVEHTMNCWRDFKADANLNVNLYGERRHEVMVCPYVFYSFFIHSDGMASMCFLDWNKKLVIGDAKNESLRKLWNDGLFDHLRSLMLHKMRKTHPICKNCDQLVAGMPVDLDDHTDDILIRMKS